jgi:hypothetical protein
MAVFMVTNSKKGERKLKMAKILYIKKNGKKYLFPTVLKSKSQ